MEEAMKQIGERLRGLREIMDLEVSELAALCGVSEERYLKIERGEADITISNLMKIARRCGVSADVLMFGEEPHMKSYYVTRRGQGLSVERTKAYKYESLTSGFQNRKANAFIVAYRFMRILTKSAAKIVKISFLHKKIFTFCQEILLNAIILI